MGGGGEQAAAARGAQAVDFVYGLPPDSSTGGCVVQRSFEEDLRAAPGVVSVNVHVASDPASAERVFRLLQQQEEEEDEGEVGVCGAGNEKGGEPRSRVLIIDGIALLFLRERLHELRSPRSANDGGGGTRRGRRVLAGFVHCPFSEPFYREEPWLRAALPEHMLLDKDGGGIRAEETRLFGLFDKIIAVGAPCRGLLTSDYGVPEDTIVVLEPKFKTSVPAAASAGVAGTHAPDGATADVLPATGAAEVSAELLPPRFVSVGTLCPRKGQLALVDALRAACHAHPAELGGSVLTLVGGDGGDQAYAGAVRAAAAAAAAAAVDDDGRNRDDDDDGRRGRRAGLRVRVLGSLSHAETLETVAAGDAFLLNSCLESWAVAPVEAALRGLPVLSTRVGWLRQALPAESTIWVGSSGHAEQGHGKGGAAFPAANPAAGGSLASAADWENALLRFAHDRRRLKTEAQRAVPGLARRHGQTTVAGSRVMAVQKLLTTSAAGITRSRAWSGSVGLSGRSASLAADSAEKERVRSATVTNALACVCATCVSISGAGGAGAGLAALVATQLLMLLNLAPPWSPANLVTIIRSLIPPAVVWVKAGSDFGEVAMADVAVFGLLFVALDVVDGMLARRSKTGPTRVGAALDVESDSVAVLFLSLAASRKAWFGGFIAGVLRYLFVLATGARELPPSPIGPAGRWFAKWAALASVAALSASVGNGADDSSPFLCAAGVAVLCVSFSVDFFQIWVLLPWEAAAKAAAEAAKVAAAAASKGGVENGSGVGGEVNGVLSPAVAVVTRGGAGKAGVGGDGSKSACCGAVREVSVEVAPSHDQWGSGSSGEETTCW
eukprot:g6861.t1